MDGCSDFRYLISIVLPLSGPIIAVLFLVLWSLALEPVLFRADIHQRFRINAITTDLARNPGQQ